MTQAFRLPIEPIGGGRWADGKADLPGFMCVIERYKNTMPVRAERQIHPSKKDQTCLNASGKVWRWLR